MRVSLFEVLLTSWLVGACSGQGAAEPAEPAPVIQIPPGFPAFEVPEDNEPTSARIALGRRLFYDERLSRTQDIACASCHLQENAFADPKRVSAGVAGKVGTRNASALVNLAWNKTFFWHGGVSSLEAQAVAPIKNPVEMDMTLTEVAHRLTAEPELVERFEEAYDERPSESTITRALAAFGRSLVSGNSPYDRYVAGDEGALSEAALRGEALFNGEGGECFHCHSGFNFTSNGFRNNGIAADDIDVGRREITLKESDTGKFKIPTLRNVAVSAPYMHDGSLATLDDVIAAYVQGGRGHANTDPTIQPLELSRDEQRDLRAFLEALTDQEFLENPAFADPDL
jgi:cytochrome c peroxidase